MQRWEQQSEFITYVGRQGDLQREEKCVNSSPHYMVTFIVTCPRDKYAAECLLECTMFKLHAWCHLGYCDVDDSYAEASSLDNS